MIMMIGLVLIRSTTEGTYNVTAKLDPKYYANSTTISIALGAVHDIELIKKPVGAISGVVANPI